MKEILVEANFTHDNLGKLFHQCLFAACNKLFSEYTFKALTRSEDNDDFSENVILKKIPDKYSEKVWNNIFFPLEIFSSKIPVYFPNGKVCGLIPSKIPVVTFFRKPTLSLSKKFLTPKQEKQLHRQIQTDINRSDIVFVASDFIKQQLEENFNLPDEPVILPIASLVPDEYIDLPIGNNNEKYFLVEAENVSTYGINELLKIFIYLHTTKRMNAKLYFCGKLRYVTPEIEINFNVARQLGIIREYDNLSIGQRSALLKNAMAVLLPSELNQLPLPHLDAMKCSCPVVTSKTLTTEEFCGDAAIYTNISDFKGYINILMQVQFDENLRREHIARGIEQEKIYSWDNSAKVFTDTMNNLY